MNFPKRERGDPITEPSAIRTVVAIIEATGLFTIACREWRAKPPTSRTMPNFETHFRLADKEHRRSATTTDGGYHPHPSANSANDLPYNYGTINDLYSASPYEGIPDLGALSLQPSSSTGTITTSPEAFAAAVAAATPSVASSITVTPEAFAAAVASAVAATPTPNRPTNNRLRRDPPPHPTGGTWSYCWSHGYLTNPRYCSSTCNHKKPGHKDDATLKNQKGGRTFVWTAGGGAKS